MRSSRNLPLLVIAAVTLLVMVCLLGPVAVHAVTALHDAGRSM